MFGLFKRNKEKDLETNTAVASSENTEQAAEVLSSGSASWWGRLKQSLQKTRAQLSDGLASLILGKKQIDLAVLEEIEERLLLSDVGIEATQKVIADLTARLARNQLKDGEAVLSALKQDLVDILIPCEQAFDWERPEKPTVILMVGMNGAGKTTTIGKLAKALQSDNKQVLLAAGDTFRAAAIEQLQVWGERNQIAVIAQTQGSDSASVVFDAFQSAKAKQLDVLIADTAGRLHTQSHLMEELKKVKRVLQKLDPNAPHEVLLVLDASIGQNAINQAKQFHESIGLTGLVITKLDGTAKGGVIFAIAQQLQLPIRYLGVGEKIDDLRPFEAQSFVDALFS